MTIITQKRIRRSLGLPIVFPYQNAFSQKQRWVSPARPHPKKAKSGQRDRIGSLNAS